MPSRCAVLGCTSSYTRHQGMLFHRFPREEVLRGKWISLCRNRSLNPNNARICHLHFNDCDYERNLKYGLLQLPVPRSLRILKPGALPIVNMPEAEDSEENPVLAESQDITGVNPNTQQTDCDTSVPVDATPTSKGGGSGIGRATCLLLAQQGARVLVTDINLEAARHTLSLLPGPEGHHDAQQMDVSQSSAVEEVVGAAQDRFGAPPSLLANCAGLFEMTPHHQMTEERLRVLFDVNLKGTFLVTQAVTRALLTEGEGPAEGRGAVVNISSIVGKTGFPGMNHYAATKGGVTSFTKSCAAELAGKGIRVNCVSPGPTDTPMLASLPETLLEAFKNTSPLGRYGRPEELAEVVVFLLSRRSSYMVGACVEVTGGMMM